VVGALTPRANLTPLFLSPLLHPERR
jgi:hypothetical protein